MISTKVLLRTTTIKPVFVPIGIQLIRRAQATFTQALPSTLETSSTVASAKRTGTKERKQKKQKLAIDGELQPQVEAISAKPAAKPAKRTKLKKLGIEGNLEAEVEAVAAKVAKSTKRTKVKKSATEGNLIPEVEAVPAEKVAKSTKGTKLKSLGIEGELPPEIKTVVAETVKKPARKTRIKESGTLPIIEKKRGTRRKKLKEEEEEEEELPVTPSKPIKSSSRKKKSEDVTPLAAQVKPEPIKLRDYQQECIDAVLDHVKQGHKRLAISLATGSGKTVIFTQLIAQLSPPNEVATQTLILVHRRELVEQALRHCQMAYPHKTVEVEMANKVASGVADITLASIQSIVSKDRIEKFDPKRFKLILIDECHHAVSSTYMQTLDHFGALHPENSGGKHPVVVGVSATLSRHDGLKMGAVLDYIVYHKDYIDMIRDKWLSDVHFTTVQTHVDLSAVRNSQGDYNVGDLSRAVNTQQTNDITVRAWLEKAGTRKSTLVFCVDIAHVVEMANTFRKHGIDARFVTSLTKKEERSQRLADFRNGVFPVLVNCGILTEGTDIPNIDCVLLARPTRSKNLLIQMIGRGMRLSPGKKSCHVIDMIGVLDRGIISTPTLFGLDPFTIIDNATPEYLNQVQQDHAEGMNKVLPSHAEGMNEILPSPPEALSPSSETEKLQNIPIKHLSFTDYETIYDLLIHTSHDQQIRQFSHYAWVRVGPSDYVLSTTGKEIRINRLPDGTYTVSTKSPAGYNFFAGGFLSPPIKILAEGLDSLEHAVSGADTYATKHCPRNLIMHSAPWRHLPATPAQIQQLKKMKPEGDWDQKKLTKGQAGDTFTRMKHGFSKLSKELEKAKKAREAESKMLEAKKLKEIKVGKIL